MAIMMESMIMKKRIYTREIRVKIYHRQNRQIGLRDTRLSSSNRIIENHDDNFHTTGLSYRDAVQLRARAY